VRIARNCSVPQLYTGHLMQCNRCSVVCETLQIAAAMELSSQTVKNDLSRVFQKVQMSSRAETQ